LDANSSTSGSRTLIKWKRKLDIIQLITNFCRALDYSQIISQPFDGSASNSNRSLSEKKQTNKTWSR
jgi:hypothetical protein